MDQLTHELCQPPLFPGVEAQQIYVEDLSRAFLEDGFEVFVSATDAELVWNGLPTHVGGPRIRERCRAGCDVRMMPTGFRKTELVVHTSGIPVENMIGYRVFSYCSNCGLVGAEL